MSATVELQGVAKSFGAQTVVKGLDLVIQTREFITLLGPSGCGKSTTLNLIAGLLRPDAGVVFLRGEPANDIEPRRRRLGMVFQTWALFPHMTVFENIAFGLVMRGRSGAEVRQKVLEMLELVRLPDVGDKYPPQLSGGMQQRIALARALAVDPDILLLDEPLSNLDARLRRDMQVELKRLHEHLRITTVFVTHSQEEALVMSDRIAVMNQGRIFRIDSPHEVYRNPRSRFVCTFLGEANIFEGVVQLVDDGTAVVASEGLVLRVRASGALRPGARATVAVRPEFLRVRPRPSGSAENVIPGAVADVVYKGSNISYYVRTGEKELLAVEPTSETGQVLQRGEHVVAECGASAFSVLEED